MNKIECFKIQVLKTDDIFDIKNGEVIKQINCETNTIVKEPKTIQADPFLFVSNNILYLFYEEVFRIAPVYVSNAEMMISKIMKGDGD